MLIAQNAKIAILALPDMILLDLTIPLDTFRRALNKSGDHCYQVWLASSEKTFSCSGVRISTDKPISSLRSAHTIIVPGIENLNFVLPKKVRAEIIRAHHRGARVVSICSGAFILAQTGLLDHKRAKTHWMAAGELQTRHPEIKVDPNVLYVDQGQVMTSAGAFAGMDLCLHILRKDFGVSVAKRVAQIAVTPLERTGGQAQFISHDLPDSSQSLNSTLAWMKFNLKNEIGLEDIADRARMSVRTLSRQFKKQIGISPQKWMTHARIQHARLLLETTDKSIEEVSDQSGFPSPLAMRKHFAKVVRATPSSYRSSFRRLA